MLAVPRSLRAPANLRAVMASWELVASNGLKHMLIIDKDLIVSTKAGTVVQRCSVHLAFVFLLVHVPLIVLH